MKGGIVITMHADNYYYDIIRRNIRKYRKQRKLTQQKLADMAGISTDYLAEIESLKRKKGFSIAVLGRLADCLEVDVKKLFYNKQ